MKADETSFFSEAELSALDFKAIGKSVKISRKASFYNSDQIEIGDNSRIDDFCVISAGEGGVYIGQNVHIAVYTSLIGQGRIVIEDYANISSRVSVYSSNDDYSGNYMTNPTVSSKYTNVTNAPVHIGRHVIVGSGSIILPGVILDDGACIGALSLVNRNCASFTINGGIPIRFIKERSRGLEDKYRAHKMTLSSISNAEPRSHKESFIKNSIGARIVVVGVVAIVLAMYFRLYFGVDLSDEGFYLAMSYFFARGGQPFVHEWLSQQGSAVIFAPFVKIYISLIGSSDGLVLFGRHAYFLVSLFASWSIWRLCRRHVPSVAALFPALLPIVFHPGVIPNISYNTLGALGWLLGLGFIYSCYLPAARGRIAAFAGAAFLVIAAFSYPSMLAIAVVVLCVSFLFTPNPERGQEPHASIRKNHRISLLLGTSLTAIPLLYVVFSNGFQPLLTSYEYASASPYQGGGWPKIWFIYNSIIQDWRYGALILSLLIFFAAPSFPKLWRWLGVIVGAVLLFPGVVILEHIWNERHLFDTSSLVIWLGLLSPIIFLFRPDLAGLKHLLVIWPLSILAGLTTAWTSYVWLEGALGLMPAAVLSLFFAVRAWNCRNVLAQVIRSVPVFFLLICIAAPQFLRVYQESPLIDLRIRIASGPYHGLFTGWKPVEFYEITADLASVRTGRNSLFIFNGDFPGFYLMSDLMPSGPTVWVHSLATLPVHTHMLQKYFSLPNHLPDVLVIMVKTDENPLAQWFLKMGYNKKIDKPGYRIYVRA